MQSETEGNNTKDNNCLQIIENKDDQTIPTQDDHNISSWEDRITYHTIKSAMKIVKPSCLRDFEIEIPKVRFTDIFGYHDAKKTMYESIILPFERPDLFKTFKLKPPKGILM